MVVQPWRYFSRHPEQQYWSVPPVYQRSGWIGEVCLPLFGLLLLVTKWPKWKRTADARGWTGEPPNSNWLEQVKFSLLLCLLGNCIVLFCAYLLLKTFSVYLGVCWIINTALMTTVFPDIRMTLRTLIFFFMLQSTLNYKSIYIWLKDWSRDKVYFWVVLQDERLATKESEIQYWVVVIYYPCNWSFIVKKNKKNKYRNNSEWKGIVK